VTRRANAYVVAGILVTGSALAIPALGFASAGGGAGLGTGTTTSSTTSSVPTSTPTTTSRSSGVVQPGNVTVSASGNGITVSARASAVLYKGVHFTGTVPASNAGDTIEIERLGRQTHWNWAPTAHGTAGANGSFTAFWPANHIGRFQIRAVIEGRSGSTASASSPSPAMTIIVYRMAIATLYGPGEYGSTTACGETLHPNTIGTANRTLPCGMRVSIYWHGRTMVVPVIDRGPYANHADWDLTMATAKKLGMDGTETIGAVSLPTK
jgi:rare lipoprotein A